MEKVKIHTLGCKVNQYESQAIKDLFEKEGYELTEGDLADIYVINTCTVTNSSDSKSRQIIRRYKRKNPQATMVVMGCYSQISPDQVEEIDQVDIIMGTSNKNQVVELVEDYKRQKNQINQVEAVDKLEDFQDLNINQIDGMTRAYIKVQDGCNQYCSYCIIPYARGPIRSRDPKDSLDEVERLAKKGFKEIILTGIHLASFGKDLANYELIDLIEDISKIEGVERIRLSSLEPSLIDREFLERSSKIPEFCDHFHLSLQAGSDSVLKRMNRKYTTSQYREIVKNIRKFYPLAGITTDIIVGFPGESEEEFIETYKFVEEIKFSKVHVFKFSQRQGTPAARRKDQIDGNIKNQRSSRLIELTDKLEEDFFDKHLGKNLEVLYEREKDGYYLGHSKNYLQVKTKSLKSLENIIVNTDIIDSEENQLIGKI